MLILIVLYEIYSPLIYVRHAITSTKNCERNAVNLAAVDLAVLIMPHFVKAHHGSPQDTARSPVTCKKANERMINITIAVITINNTLHSRNEEIMPFS